MEPIKTNVWKSAYWVGSLLALFLLLLSIAQVKGIFNIGDNSPAMNMITVNGKGEAVAIPDIATFSFTVNEKAKTVSVAQENSAKKMNAVLSTLKAQGIAEKDVKTQGYSINPNYEYTNGVCTTYQCAPGKSVLIGYEVSQTVEVKIRDITKAGTIFDSIGTLEVENLNGLSFSVDSIDSVREEARAEAIADAKTKANKLAKDLGVRIVRIVSFNDSGDYPYPVMHGMGGDSMISAKAESAPARTVADVPAGEQKITSNVSISYEIR